MMNFVMGQVRDHIRRLPREAKLDIVSRYILPECDLEDLAGLQVLVQTEVDRRRQSHNIRMTRMVEALR